jgi:hypothetical protein
VKTSDVKRTEPQGDGGTGEIVLDGGGGHEGWLPDRVKKQMQKKQNTGQIF